MKEREAAPGGGTDRSTSTVERTRVLIVEGQPVIRDALTALLIQEHEFNVASVPSLEDGIRAAVHGVPPDVVVMDLPASRDVNEIRKLADICPPPRVLVLSEFSTVEDVGRALQAGAQGFVSRREPSESLMTGIRFMQAKKRYMCPTVLDLYLRSTATEDAPAQPQPLRHRLTRREREVLELISQGETDRQIGTKLGLSIKTVHTYRTRIMEKLDVHSVGLLVRRAIQLGLVVP